MSAPERRRRRVPLDVALAIALLAGGGLAVAEARPGVTSQQAPPAAAPVPSGDGIEPRAAVDEVPTVAHRPAVSDDGRFVAFTSSIGNLVPGDANFSEDAFVFDRVTSTVEAVSVGAGGAPVGGVVGSPAITGDGRYVVFTSSAASVVTGDDASGIPDVFRRDRQTGTTTRVSRPTSGAALNSSVGALSTGGAVSDDGRWVVYESAATNLVAGDVNRVSDVFVRDMSSNANVRLSVATSGQPDRDSVVPVISGDGTTVAFQSYASNLVAGDTNARPDAAQGPTADVFVRARTGGATQRVSTHTNGTQTEPGRHSSNPSLSHDGTRVAFESDDTTKLFGGTDANGGPDVFMRDRSAGTTRRVSATGANGVVPGNAPAFGPVISGDGNHVVYLSAATNVNGSINSTGGRVQVFRASTTGAYNPRTMSLVHGASTALSSLDFPNAGQGTAVLTHDGAQIVFVSAASNLARDAQGEVTDTNQAVDIFVRDPVANTTAILPLMSQDPVGNLVVDGSFERPAFDSGSHGVRVLGADSQPVVGGWSLLAGGVDVVGYRAASAGDGMQFLDLNGGDNAGSDAFNTPEPRTRISQRVATTVNRRYRLTALVAGNPVQEPVVKEMRIQFGPLTRDTSFDVTGNTNANLRWEEVSLELDACATETDLSFATRTTGVRGPLLDRVRVVEVGPAQVPCCVDPGPFNDVPAGHPFCEDITWLVDRNVTTGYQDGGYHPDAPVTRQAMAAFLSRMDSRSPRPACTAKPFPDVELASQFCREIAWMKSSGIAGGYADGSFRPDAPISRQAMSAFLQRAYGGGAAEACLTGPFPDVPANHQYCPEVRWMIRSAITGGYGDGRFHPTASVSRQAMAAFLRRAASM